MVTDFQEIPCGLLLRSTFPMFHTQMTRNLVVPVPPDGLFPDALPPVVFPLVLDTNFLQDEILRMGHSKIPTILVSTANSGGLRLYCTQRVIDEIDEQLAVWAQAAGIDAQSATTWWQKTHRRLLRVVDMSPGEGLFTPPETTRLHVLAEKSEDDLPTAKLALLLSAPVLSNDADVVVAAGGGVRPPRSTGPWIMPTVVGPGRNLVHGASTLVGTSSEHRLLFVPVAGRHLYVYLVSDETNQQIVDGLNPEGATFLRTTDLSAAGEAMEKFDQLAAPSCDLQELAHTRGTDAVLARVCMSRLARHRQSQVSAAELQTLLRPLVEFPSNEQTIKATLRDSACFTPVSQDRFQLGRSVGCSAQ